MSCAAIKTVRVEQHGRVYVANCEDHRSQSPLRDRAAKIAAASAWSAFFREDISPDQIKLTGKSCTAKSCTFEARCFKVTAAAKPLARKSVKLPAPARSTEKVEMAFAACRSMKFAGDDALRRGSWDRNSLIAAYRIALVALGEHAALEDTVAATAKLEEMK